MLSRSLKFKRNALPRLLGFIAALALVLGATTLPWPHEANVAVSPPRAAADLKVSVDQFARYLEDWSEPEGYFDSDNFISNETSYLHVIDQLRRRVKPAGVYLGVGPDQNFSYITHTRPMLAIITDIRRQNMLQHLWFKALFARAANRAEFLALMFSRRTPAVKPAASLEEILDAVRSSQRSDTLFQENFAAVRNFLLEKYKLKLSSDDLEKIDYVYRTFYEEGLDLRFSSIGRGNALNYPTFEDMLLATDRAGRQQNFLSSEELFQWLKQFQAENRLIPIVGNFAGPHALKRVGAFLKSNGLQVSAFYTSNVEFYLFNRFDWIRYVANVRSLPVGEDSVFIRAYFGNGPRHPENMPGHRATSVVNPMGRFLEEAGSGRLDSYWDVVRP